MTLQSVGPHEVAMVLHKNGLLAKNKKLIEDVTLLAILYYWHC